MTIHILLNSEGYITFASADAVKLVGYPAAQLTGTSINAYLSHDSLIQVIQFAQHINNTDSLTLKTQFKKQADEWIPVELHLTRLPGGAPSNMMMSITAVSNVAGNHHNESHVGQSFFESYPAGVIQIGANGKVQMINTQLQADWGHSLESLQQTQLLNFVPASYQKKLLKRVAHARTHKRPSVFDLQLYNAVGAPVHINLTIFPVLQPNKATTLYLMLKDISGQVQMQNKLKRLSAVADKTTNGVAIVDSDFCIEWANDVFCRITQYGSSELIGKQLCHVLQTGCAEPSLKSYADQMATTGQPLEQEITCYRKDGSSFWNLAKLTPVFDDTGRLERFITVHDDITEKKTTELELRRLADDLYKQNKELHQFAYIVSHNVRSPVANILGLTNLLQTFKDDEQTRADVLQQLTQSVNNLDMVIKDLSYILTISDGSREVFQEPVNIQDLLQQVMADMHLSITESNAQITLPAKRLVIRTNRAYLYSIFFNLISNALKYRSPQSPYVKVDYYNTLEQTVIYVADNGKGIDLQKHADNLFKPYKRFDLRAEGKGLGLFLVKSHVEAMGGQLSVKSELRKGSTFYIKLPLV